MAPARDGLRFFVDETSLGLGKVLAIARQDVIHTGHRLIPEVPCAALDDEWMPIVAELGLAVITRDKKIRNKHAKTLLYSDYGLRVFAIGGKQNLSNWETLVRVVHRWSDIERELKEHGPGPWFKMVNASRLADLHIKDRDVGRSSHQ